jgi:hypothetical protein
MPQPIYNLVLAKGHKEAWYQLSKREQDALWAKGEEIDRRAGAKLKLACDSRWADEDLFGWAVLEYPDMEAYRVKVAALEELQWWRYFDVKSVLGTPMEEN